MLDKEVCKKCRQLYGFPADKEWLDNDEARWNRGTLFCPHYECVLIKAPPSDRCKCKFEQGVAAGMPDVEQRDMQEV